MYLSSALANTRAGQLFIFLDEISNVRDWQYAIKSLKDTGELDGCTVVTTGSHTVDISRAAELLPGRRGSPRTGVLDHVLLPMTFFEFVRATNRELYDQIAAAVPVHQEARAAAVRTIAAGSAGEAAHRLWAWITPLEQSLEMYMRCGGIPAIADEFARTGSVSPGIYAAYLAIVRGGMDRLGLSSTRLNALLARIAESVRSAVSWSSLKRDAGIASHHTVESYVNVLDEMYIVSLVHRYSSSSGRPKFDSGKKIYFRDPFFLHAASAALLPRDPFGASLGYLDDPELKSAMVEQVVAEHAVRAALALGGPLKDRFDYHHAVFYWQGESKKEVDFVVRNGDSVFPIEVKYQGRVRGCDLRGLLAFGRAAGAQNGVVLTRSDIGDAAAGGIAMVPVPVFLFLV